MTRPLRTLLVTLGSHGDVRPLLAIGAEIARRGGDAAIVTNPHFEPDAERAGVGFIPFGPRESVRAWVSRRPATMDGMRGPLTVLREIIAPRTASLVASVRAAIDTFSPDVVVGHQACIGTRWACRQVGVPYIDVALSPCAWMNPRDTLSLTPWRGVAPTPRAVRFDVWVGRRLTGWLSDGAFNRARRSLGLPPVRQVWFDELGASCPHLGLWSPLVRPVLDGDPPGAMVTGFARLQTERDERLPERLHRFLDEGPPPAVITLGTAVSHAQPSFHASVAGALAETGLRVVLVTGDDDYVPANLPPSMLATGEAPFGRLFPRASLVVHHGGIGTCAEAMVAGTPALVLPAAHDQFDNAARCVRLGVAKVLPLARASGRRLRRAILEAAGDAAMRTRAGEVSRGLRGESGAGAAVDAIESCVGGALTRERRPACRC
jgi:UDP:flavonoid glycosyltransferase YjiC (YdhE family)